MPVWLLLLLADGTILLLVLVLSSVPLCAVLLDTVLVCVGVVGGQVGGAG